MARRWERPAVTSLAPKPSTALTRCLQRRGDHLPLGDKEAFARFCAERQVSVIPVLLSAHSGELRGSSELPKADLFVKPVHERGGRAPSDGIMSAALTS